MARKFSVEAELKATDRASPVVRKVEGRFRSLTNFVKSRMVITFGEAARAIQAAFALIGDAANLESQENALRRSLAAQGLAFDSFIAKLDEVAQSQISTADLIKSSSQALLLGIPADKIAELLDVARVSAIATGQSISDAFRDIATGVGRASPLILDNLGIVVKLTDVYNEAAEEIGVTSDQLSQQEKLLALLNEVLKTGAERTETFGDAQSDLAVALNQGTAALQNFKNRGATAFVSIGFVLASLATRLVAAFTTLVAVVVQLTSGLASLAARLPFVGSAFKAVAEETSQWGESLQATITALNKQRAALDVGAVAAMQKALGLATETTEDLGKATGKLGRTNRDTTDTTNDLAEATREFTASELEATRAIDAGTFALQVQAQQAALTASQFDALAASAGRAAAVSAGIAGGGTLEAGGTRLRLRGGSRLVGEGGLFPGLSGTSYVVTTTTDEAGDFVSRQVSPGG